MPGQRFADAVDWAVGDALEGIAQVGVGVEAISFAVWIGLWVADAALPARTSETANNQTG